MSKKSDDFFDTGKDSASADAARCPPPEVNSAGGRMVYFLFFSHGTQREKQKIFSLREKDGGYAHCGAEFFDSLRRPMAALLRCNGQLLSF